MSKVGATNHLEHAPIWSCRRLRRIDISETLRRLCTCEIGTFSMPSWHVGDDLAGASRDMSNKREGIESRIK